MCISPRQINDPKNKGEKITVNCGKCILCRRRKCREWALKLYHESQYYSKMCMITLTFRPNFLLKPKIKKLTKYHSKRQNDGTIEYKKEHYTTMINPTYIQDVRKTGWLVTLFIKKLRKWISKQDRFISYYAVGEHGTQKTKRAHWHIIFFGLDINDLKGINIGKSKKNKDTFYSKKIEELWNYDNVNIGLHTISEITPATIKYVANYTMKKMYNNNKKEYPTIMRCSSHNKIGKKWARKYHKELRKDYLTDGDGAKYSIPKSYYNEMIRFENTIENETMNYTAQIIENKKIKKIKEMLSKGLLKNEEMKKKAKKLENYYSKVERDTI